MADHPRYRRSSARVDPLADALDARVDDLYKAEPMRGGAGDVGGR
jgi:hypothetical protein